jgi:NADH-quinone oxidoreductase subunit I
MNCGFCAEYCPFDAIKMDHDFDIASYGRNVYNLEKLLKSKPASYYKSIRPVNYAREDEAARIAQAEAKKAAKAEASGGGAVSKANWSRSGERRRVNK